MMTNHIMKYHTTDHQLLRQSIQSDWDFSFLLSLLFFLSSAQMDLLLLDMRESSERE